MTAAQVVSTFAQVVGNNTIFTFNNQTKLTIVGINDETIFNNDIMIV